MNDQILLMESSFIENNTKQAFREVKLCKECFKSRIDLCKDNQGKIISYRQLKVGGRKIFNNFLIKGG
jgi:hypothetical protein